MQSTVRTKNFALLSVLFSRLTYKAKLQEYKFFPNKILIFVTNIQLKYYYNIQFHNSNITENNKYISDFSKYCQRTTFSSQIELF